MTNSIIPTSPYIGLIPYSEKDAPLFFGREEKIQVITANLMASRLTLFHGPSGVGKSSVLRAGVAHKLREAASESLAAGRQPEFAVVVFSSWRDDPVDSLATRVRDSVAQLVPSQTVDPLPASRDLTRTLQTWTKQDPNDGRPDLDLLIILDQFEEYFLYHPKDEGDGTFAAELPRAINSCDLRVNFLISIREDALAKLERFKGSIPHLFDNRLSIEHLDRRAARDAIIKPLDQYNKLYLAGGEPFSIEPALVEAVLDQIKTGQVVLAQAGRGTVEDGSAAVGETARIETPYLQMVMTRLWEEELSAGSRVLRLNTLNSLGGAANIVRTHLDKTMADLTPAEQDIAARIFYHLVTPGGTKIAHSVPDLAAFADVSEEQLNPVLLALSDKSRMLRPVDPAPGQTGVQRYEIFHDVLAPAILDWRTRYMQAQNQAKAAKQAAEEAANREREAADLLKVQQAEALAEAERQRADEQRRRVEYQTRSARRLTRVLVALAVMFLLAAVSAVLAFTQSSVARQKEIQTSIALGKVQEEKKRADDQTVKATEARVRAEQKELEAKDAELKARKANERETMLRKAAEKDKEKIARLSRYEIEQAQFEKNQAVFRADEAEYKTRKAQLESEQAKFKVEDEHLRTREKAEQLKHEAFDLYRRENLTEAIKKYSDARLLYEELKDIGQQAMMLDFIGRLYTWQKQPASAEKSYNDALRLFRDAKQNDEKVAEVLDDLASLRQEQGKRRQAAESFQGALDIRLKLPVSAKTAESYRNLGQIYSGEDDSVKAETYFRRALEIRQKILTANDPALGQSYIELGDVLMVLDRYPEAESLYKRGLNIYKSASEADPGYDLTVLNCLNRVGDLYTAWGKYAPAEDVLRQSIALGEKTLDKLEKQTTDKTGNQNPGLAAQPQEKSPKQPQSELIVEYKSVLGFSWRTLGLVYYYQARYAEAEQLCKQTLEIDRVVKGRESWEVARDLHNLALIYLVQAKYDLVEPNMREAMAIDDKNQDKRQELRSRRLLVLARLYREQARYAEAERLFLEVLNKMLQAKQGDDSRIAFISHYLAQFYAGQSKYPQAESYAKKAITGFENESLFGPDHWFKYRSLITLGMIYAGEGGDRYKDAESLYKESLERLESVLGADHPEIANVLNNLAELYLAQKRYGEAEPLLRRAIDIRKARLGPEHPDVALSLNNLGKLYRDQNKYVEAEKFFEQALAIREKSKPDHPDLAQTLEDYAILLRKTNRLEEAANIEKRAKAIREKLATPRKP